MPGVTRCLLAAMACLLGATGCDPEPAGAAARDGRALYQALCTSCHGPHGRPPEAMAARLGVRDLSGGEFRARVTAALVARQVREGSTSKLMPSFAGLLDDAQITALAAYVASPQFAQPPPAPR